MFQSLGKYNVNINETSVSGFSSGAFFAVQMHVAFSSFIKGAGIVAGGPYNCASDKIYIDCMYENSPILTNSINTTLNLSPTEIDDIDNMKNQKIYIISGSKDTIVGRSVVDQLYSYYVICGRFVDKENVVYKKIDSVHTFPTDFDSPNNNPCGSAAMPFISNCGFDGAGAILKHIYGDLNPRTTSNGSLSSEKNETSGLIQFKQSEFLSSPRKYGLDTNGYIYVPESCQGGSACRLHIVFHGCAQSNANIQMKFVQNTGYDKWAETNNLIILFPQTYPDSVMHSTPASYMSSNGNACWDFVGWYGDDFQSKSGKQLSTIYKMIERITSGA